MTVEVRYFGMISDRLNCSSETHTFEEWKGEVNLRTYFENRFPELKDMSYKIAVNQELTDVVNSDSNINEIALLPPFAGG